MKWQVVWQQNSGSSGKSFSVWNPKVSFTWNLNDNFYIIELNWSLVWTLLWPFLVKIPKKGSWQLVWLKMAVKRGQNRFVFPFKGAALICHAAGIQKHKAARTRGHGVLTQTRSPTGVDPYCIPQLCCVCWVSFNFSHHLLAAGPAS